MCSLKVARSLVIIFDICEGVTDGNAHRVEGTRPNMPYHL